jgi:hypothetical protein
MADFSALTPTPGFFQCMFDANGALLALDALEPRDNELAIGSVVNDAAFVYAELLVLQKTQKVSPSESARLQVSLDRLRAKLHFFGLFV